MHPLITALQAQDTPQIKALINSGSEVNVSDEMGQTALHLAVDLAFELAMRQTDLEVKKEGFHFRRPDFEVFGLLLAAGADPEARDLLGKTAIDWAADREAYEFVGELKEMVEGL